jgi:hypothetical protein
MSSDKGHGTSQSSRLILMGRPFTKDSQRSLTKQLHQIRRNKRSCCSLRPLWERNGLGDRWRPQLWLRDIAIPVQCHASKRSCASAYQKPMRRTDWIKVSWSSSYAVSKRHCGMLSVGFPLEHPHDRLPWPFHKILFSSLCETCVLPFAELPAPRTMGD